MDSKNTRTTSNCNLCNDTGCLTQKGILKVYLLAAKFPIILMVAGIIGGLFFSRYMLILAGFGLIYPLAMADLRIYLYPIASIACSLGKELNCPKCEPGCSMFRKG
jgi:hypothetical protein